MLELGGASVPFSLDIHRMARFGAKCHLIPTILGLSADSMLILEGGKIHGGLVAVFVKKWRLFFRNGGLGVDR